MRSHQLRFVRCAVAAGCGALLFVTALASTGRAEGVSPVEWRPGTTEWDPVAARQHGLALEVAFRESCFERNYRATVKEARMSVTIAVHYEGAVFAPGHGVISCPVPRQRSLVLQLHRPLAGRLIGGPALATEPRAAFGYVATESERVTVPDLIGFAPQDAELALNFGYLHGRVLLTRASGLPHVVAQAPAAGHMMSRQSVVRLFVAR
jgi:hypothetical protein